MGSFARIVILRFRLMLSVLMGVMIFLLLGTTSYTLETRLLVSWDSGALFYLVLALWMMCSSTLDCMKARARAQDDGATVILVFTLVAATASIFAILLELARIKTYPASVRPWHLMLAGLTIFCSWTLVHTAFALHYAHEFYDPKEDPLQPCLIFSGKGLPDYWDFMYFSFVIGTTSQTADISMASSAMRRLGLLHGIIAFFFNTTIVAMTVNIAASLT
jgi:uncharacterized membrane protein